MSGRAWLGIGGNQGDVIHTLSALIHQLQTLEWCNSLLCSSLYETYPMGEHAGDSFVNAALVIDTTLNPWQLLEACQQLEVTYGRIRERHWGPRTLDIDILFYDDLLLSTPELKLPHPDVWFRRFVLDPLCEIDPDKKHPKLQLTVKELSQRLNLPYEVWLSPAELWKFLLKTNPPLPSLFRDVVVHFVDEIQTIEHGLAISARDHTPCRTPWLVLEVHDQAALYQGLIDGLTAAFLKPQKIADPPIIKSSR